MTDTTERGLRQNWFSNLFRRKPQFRAAAEPVKLPLIKDVVAQAGRQAPTAD